MTAAEFEAWSTGKTLVYSLGGSLWGSEMHLAGRSTLDDGDGDICRPGRWYAEGDNICFTDEANSGPFCWRFFRDGDQVFAEAAADAVGARYSVALSDMPVSCTPGLGV
jgi:hypothetical protein